MDTSWSHNLWDSWEKLMEYLKNSDIELETLGYLYGDEAKIALQFIKNMQRLTKDSRKIYEESFKSNIFEKPSPMTKLCKTIIDKHDELFINIEIFFNSILKLPESIKNIHCKISSESRKIFCDIKEDEEKLNNIQKQYNTQSKLVENINKEYNEAMEELRVQDNYQISPFGVKKKLKRLIPEKKILLEKEKNNLSDSFEKSRESLKKFYYDSLPQNLQRLEICNRNKIESVKIFLDEYISQFETHILQPITRYINNIKKCYDHLTPDSECLHVFNYLATGYEPPSSPDQFIIKSTQTKQAALFKPVSQSKLPSSSKKRQHFIPELEVERIPPAKKLTTIINHIQKINDEIFYINSEIIAARKICYTFPDHGVKIQQLQDYQSEINKTLTYLEDRKNYYSSCFFRHGGDPQLLSNINSSNKSPDVIKRKSFSTIENDILSDPNLPKIDLNLTEIHSSPTTMYQTSPTTATSNTKEDESLLTAVTHTNNDEVPSDTNNNEVPSDTNNNEVPSDTNNNELLSDTNNNEVPSDTNNNELLSDTNNDKLPSDTHLYELPPDKHNDEICILLRDIEFNVPQDDNDIELAFEKGDKLHIIKKSEDVVEINLISNGYEYIVEIPIDYVQFIKK